MKKKLQCIKSAFLALTLITTVSFAQTTALDYDFETASHATWTTIHPNVTLTIVADPANAANNVLQFETTDNYKSASIDFPMSTATDAITTLSYKFYPTAVVSGNFSQEYQRMDGTTTANPQVRTGSQIRSSGQLVNEVRVIDGGNSDVYAQNDNSKTVSRSTWHTMEIVIDPSAGTNPGTGTVVYSVDAGIPFSFDNVPLDGIVFNSFTAGVVIGQPYFIDDLLVTYEVPLSNNKFAFNKEVSFSPNPAKNDLKIVLKEKTNFNLSMYNVIGAQVLNTDYTNEHEANVSISNLKTGIYLAKITTSNGQVAVRRIVKN